jgi:hypothetical protein
MTGLSEVLQVTLYPRVLPSLREVRSTSKVEKKKLYRYRDDQNPLLFIAQDQVQPDSPSSASGIVMYDANLSGPDTVQRHL